MSEYNEIIKQYQEKSKGFDKLFSNIRERHLLIIVAFIIIGIMLYNRNPKDLQTILLFGVGIMAVYFMSIMNNPINRNSIERHIVQKLANLDLNRMIGSGGAFPIGTRIIETPYCHLKHIDTEGKFKPSKWEIGFIIIENNVQKYILYQMQPYTGQAVGIKELHTGYDGTASKDILIIYPETVFKKEESHTPSS